MQIIDNLLSRRVTNPEKQVTISCGEKKIVTVVQEILVWWKRGWSRMVSNEINDGAQVVLVQERPILIAKIDTLWLMRGMSLYQEYDEIADAVTTYLYKFPKDEQRLGATGTCLATYAPGYQIAQQGRFVTISGDVVSFDDEEKMLVTLTHAGHSGLLSFLLGLVLAYGKIDREAEVLHTIHMSIPLVGSIAQRVYLIEHVVAALAGVGIFIQTSIQDQQHGQVMQVMITDWEALYLLQHWLREAFQLCEVSKYTTYQSMKQTLMTHLEEETNERGLIEKVEYGVVKLLRK